MPEELVPQRVRTPESNTLCRVRSITALKPLSKRAMCLPKYTGEVQTIRASAPVRSVPIGHHRRSGAAWRRVSRCSRRRRRSQGAAEPQGTTAP